MQPRSEAPAESARPAYRWLIWLMTGCTSMPRCHGTTQRFFDPHALAGCVHCGRGKEPVAYQIGSRYCQRCVRVVMRHHLLAEHPSAYAAQ